MSDLITTLKHQDLIYDIGMHKGEDSEFYLKKGFRVIAFEANPDLVKSCKERLKEFIDAGKLIIVEGAIVDPKTTTANQGKVLFYKDDDVSVWGTVCANWAERNAKLGSNSYTIEIEAIDFAKVLQTHGVPHYMKIDIEGCDMICVEVLNTFKERPDYISLEADKTSMEQVRHEIAALALLGYTGFKAVEQSRIPQVQSPPRPATEGEYVAHQFEEGSSGLFGSELEGEWKPKSAILREYRFIVLGYYLLDEVMAHWKFKGSRSLRALTCKSWPILTKTLIPGWYDTHARLAGAQPPPT